MPKPKNKNDLFKLSCENYEKLITFIDSIPDKNKEFPKVMLNRNIRDVLAHLHNWHLLFLNWYEDGMNGQTPKMPAEGYTWKTVSLLNKKVRDDYQSFDLSEILQKLDDSHSTINEIINNHTEKELFEKNKYKWTGTTSLGAYLISATSSHYDWAVKKIKFAYKQ